MKRISILNVPFIKIDQEHFVQKLHENIKDKQKAFVVTANPEIVMLAQRNKSYLQLINDATYVTADGVGIIHAARILGEALPGRVTGFDTMTSLLQLANENKYAIFFLGASQETLDQALINIKKKYPNINIAGSHHGYFSNQEEISQIVKEANPDLTFVALGAPKQEMWISSHIDKVNHGIFIGVGGSFDVLAGKVKRAPKFWRKLQLEWLYRIIKQPTRIKRTIELPKFMLRVLFSRFKQNN